jgi:hypothetical protein
MCWVYILIGNTYTPTKPSPFRTDVEALKGRLRGIVEERYPDLLEAADSVGAIRTTIAGLEGRAKAIEQTLEGADGKVIVPGIEVSPGEAPASEEGRFEFAACVHLLSEVAIMAMDCAGRHNVLEAASWILLGNALDAHIQADPDMKTRAASIPYLGTLTKQRARISGRIVKRCMSSLKNPSFSVQVCASVII